MVGEILALGYHYFSRTVHALYALFLTLIPLHITFNNFDPWTVHAVSVTLTTNNAFTHFEGFLGSGQVLYCTG